jgi:hypothetical protein|tara:strand:+ start:3335 stop:3691 length:357 start_codon:yes stop_codon:yes gene_type:complete
MAYVSQENKKELAVGIKQVLKKYKIKASIGVSNHSTLVVNLKSGVIDFKRQQDHYQVNPYHIERQWTGQAKDFLMELLAAMKGEMWYDNSDAMTDYFDTAFYTDINIGKWNQNYEVTA